MSDIRYTTTMRLTDDNLAIIHAALGLYADQCDEFAAQANEGLAEQWRKWAQDSRKLHEQLVEGELESPTVGLNTAAVIALSNSPGIQRAYEHEVERD